MAPESERAMRCKFQRAGEHLRCELEAGHVGAHVCHGFHCGCADCVKKDWTPEPNEPTLTCSEVVERLAECADIEYTKDRLGGIYTATFNRAKAEKILYSWRERRVQELEKCLHEIVNERYTEFDMMRCPFPPNSAVSNAWHDGARAAWRQSDLVKQIAKDALTNSEWREQIRKGAKHE